MIPRTHWVVILGLFVLGMVVSGVLWQGLPERVPTHWNLEGKADGWGPRWQAAWLLPCVSLAVVALISVLPVLGPFPGMRSRWGGPWP
jgi:uncharacterized membrane protein